MSRFRHLALIMITLGMGLLLHEAANSASWLTGGADGLQGVKIWPIFNTFRFDLYGYTAYTYSLIVLFLVFLVARRIINSPFGLSLRGIRENSLRMPALGAPSRAHLRKIYTISAVIAGIAGALLAQTTETVSLESLGFQRSADVLVILILGGAGRLYGGLSARSSSWWRATSSPASRRSIWYFWIGLLLIAVVMFLPNGILGGLAKLTASWRERRRQRMSAALSTRGLDKSFGSLVVAKDIEILAAAGRAPRADRPERRRQDHADQPDDRHAAAGCRRDPARRRADHRAPAGQARQPRAGAHVPDQHAVSQSQRARSRDARGLRARRRGAHLVAARHGASRPRSTRRTRSSPR